MRTVSVTAAKAQFSRLLTQVERGQEVVITRHGKPVAKLVLYCRPGRRQFGALRGRVALDNRFFDPLPEHELAAWEAGKNRLQ